MRKEQLQDQFFRIKIYSQIITQYMIEYLKMFTILINLVQTKGLS